MTSVGRPALGLVLGGSMDPARIVPLATLGERLGFEEAWVVEDYFYSGGIASAAAVLQATERLTAGFGIVSGLVRHPAVLAMEIATLARMFPGRVRPGIGLGLPDWLRQMGLMPPSILEGLREAAVSVRRLLDGEELTASGRFHFDHVRLAHPPTERVPIDIGVAGPRMIELAGEVGDGLVLGLNSSPAYVEWAREHLAVGAARVGREPTHRVTVFALLSVSESARDARERARTLMGMYLGLSGRNACNDVYGISDQVMEMRDRGGIECVQREMPDRWIDDLGVVGTPDACAAQIARYAAAGADSIVFYPVDTEDPERALRMVASQLRGVTS